MLTARRFINGFGILRCASLRNVLLVTALAANVTGTAAAQQYAAMPIDEKDAKSYRATAQLCLKDAATYTANKDKFDAYFLKYYFPAMTRTGPDELKDLGKFREGLFKDFLWKATNPAVQQDLTKMAFDQMKAIITQDNPPCHPAARYNAVLVIGMLDERVGGPGQPPVVYAPATKALTTIVDQGVTTGARFTPPLILAALIGLDRHAQFHEGMAPDALAAMQAALLKLVNQEKPIQEMDRDTFGWLQLRAAGALARLGTAGDKNVIHNAIVKLASSLKSLDDRCEAAALLDRINNYKDVKLDDSGTADPLFALARDIGATEAKRAAEFQDKGTVGGGMEMRGPGGYMPSGMTDPNAFPRRQTVTRLTDLKVGLSKVKGSLPAETQKKVDGVLAAINPVITSASSKETVDLRLAESIRKMADAINTAVPGPAKAEAEKPKEAVVF